MAVAEDARVQLSVRFGLLLPRLNERQRRLLLATEARLLGHGGVRAVAQVAKVSKTTIRQGLLELDADQGPVPLGRARRPGGGRKQAEDNDPGLVPALLGWWSRTSGATLCRRCGGRPNRCGTSPQSWPGRGMRCRRPRSAGCCASRALACRAPPRP